MFSNLSIKFKLIFVFLIITSIVGIVSFFNAQTIIRLSATFEDLVLNDFPRLEVLEEIKFLSSEIEKKTLEFNLEEGSNTASSSGRLELKKFELLADLEQIQGLESKYTELLAEEDEHETGESLAGVSDLKDDVVNAAIELITLKEQQVEKSKIEDKTEELADYQDKLKLEIEKAIEKEEGIIGEENEEAKIQVRDSITLSVVYSVVTISIALLLGFLISHLIAKDLNKLKMGASEIAAGNFDVQIRINSKDEIGQVAASFNQMSAKLKDSYSRLAEEKKVDDELVQKLEKNKVAMLNIMQDLKQSNALIQQEKVKDEAILSSIGEGMYATDHRAQITVYNRSLIEILGLNPEQLIGRTVFEISPLFSSSGGGQPIPSVQHPVYVALQTARKVEEMFEFHRSDGKKILIHISANPIVQNNRITGAIMIIRDVTHEKEVDRMKTEFISLASHQLRTPLSAIKWFSEMMLGGDAGKLNAEQEDFAKNIADSTERMIELVNSLLNISRIESGRIIVEPKPTDLKELVQGIINDLKGKTEAKQQNLAVSVHPGLPEVNLDPHLIGQVYLNLLTNAIKYTPKGGDIQVFISSKEDQVISQVTDSGYGIPKAQQSKIFQKLFRAENIIKIETDGTGLGLYLVKAIVESSGGKIWFSSEEGKGTTFWFSLPLAGMKAKAGEVTLDG